MILAENLTVESYIDNDTRDEFDNAPVPRVHPKFHGSLGAATLCVPLVRQGVVLEQVMAVLTRRAGMRPYAA